MPIGCRKILHILLKYPLLERLEQYQVQQTYSPDTYPNDQIVSTICYQSAVVFSLPCNQHHLDDDEYTTQAGCRYEIPLDAKRLTLAPLLGYGINPFPSLAYGDHVLPLLQAVLNAHLILFGRAKRYHIYALALSLTNRRANKRQPPSSI